MCVLAVINAKGHPAAEDAGKNEQNNTPGPSYSSCYFLGKVISLSAAQWAHQSHFCIVSPTLNHNNTSVVIVCIQISIRTRVVLMVILRAESLVLLGIKSLIRLLGTEPLALLLRTEPLILLLRTEPLILLLRTEPLVLLLRTEPLVLIRIVTLI